jgi:hypothetical protein
MNRREQAIQKAILKCLGVRAGIPDVLALKNGRLFPLEFKTDGA